MNKVQQLLNEVSQIIKIHEEHANKQGENFNIFSILRMEKREVKTHSNFIYELLNPQGLHGQGKMFLESFAKIVLNSEVSNTAIDPQQEYLTEENRRIDFTLRTDENIIGIEMKIDAGDQENQLFDYHEELEKIANKEKGVKLFYLTLDGSEASEYSHTKDGKKVKYKCISFKIHILNWIKDCIQKSAEKSVLREALIQYKILIEKITGQNMDMNTEIAELLKNGDKLKTAIAIETGLVEAKIQLQVKFWKELLEKLNELDIEKGFYFGNNRKKIQDDYKKGDEIEDACKRYYEYKRGNDQQGIIYDIDNNERRFMLIHWDYIHFCITQNYYEKGDSEIEGEDFKNQNGWFQSPYKDKLSFHNNGVFDMLSDEKRKDTIKVLATEFKKLVKKLENES